MSPAGDLADRARILGAMSTDLAGEVILDLLRSAWIVERARASVYERWARAEPRFEASAGRCTERAALLERAIRATDGTTDDDLVPAHAGWIRSLVGSDAPDVPFGDILVARLGDWVDAHASGFLDAGAERLAALSDDERAAAEMPSEPPAPVPFEPLPTPDAEPPGEVLVRVGILADLHIGSALSEAAAAAAIDDLNRAGVDLVVQLGDVTDHGHASEFERAAQVLSKLEMPFATMMGNHDVVSIEEGRLSGREYYARWLGREPDGVLLEHGGFRFAVLDSIEMGESPFAPFDLVSGSFIEGRGGGVVRGSLTLPQHDILAEVAAPGAPPAFVLLHHPPQPFTAFPPVVFGLRDVDSMRLHATCDSRNVWGVFAGHTHRNARTREFDGVPAHEVATARDFPFGYGLVDVTARGYAYRFVQISDRDVLRAGYDATGTILTRYALGSDADRSFVWRARSD